MSGTFKDAELYLPPNLFYSNDLRMDKKIVSSPKDPFGVPFGFGSEPESEEEDFSSLSGLTRQLANSSLLDDGFQSFNSGLYPGRVRNGSSCGCGQVCSVDVVRTKSHATWQLLCAAAAEVERMKLEREVMVPTRKPGPGFASDLALYHKLQAAQLQRQREEQFLKQRRQGGVWGGNVGYGRESGVSSTGSGGRDFGVCSSSGWPRQHFGSGVRGGYNVGGKRECAGTGVFLPRRVVPTAAAEPRKKSPVSTVVLPARVVHALNLNLDEMGPVQPRFNPNGDAALRLRSGEILAPNQKRASRAQPGGVVNPEIRLPQEWTY